MCKRKIETVKTVNIPEDRLGIPDGYTGYASYVTVYNIDSQIISGITFYKYFRRLTIDKKLPLQVWK